MAKKLIGFRVGEKACEEFHQLARDSGLSIQDVLAGFVEACLSAKSIMIRPSPEGRSGLEISSELRLRESLVQLRNSMETRNYIRAELKYSNLASEVAKVHDLALLEEAESAAKSYLEWLEKEQKTSRYRGY